MQVPNVVVVVMDCVGADDFPGGAHPATGMASVDALRKESVLFPHAASVAPWTVPAHASLFTGLYPWEHSLYGSREQRLRSEIPTLAQILKNAGYRTISLSANPFISSLTGLETGFDTAGWGRWLDSWSPFRRARNPPHSIGNGSSGTPLSVRITDSPLNGALRAAQRRIAQHPVPWQLASKVIRSMGGPEAANKRTADWIEPRLAASLAGTPSDRPIFCFVNLLDAHEPYLVNGLQTHGAREWLRYARVPQDPTWMLEGSWTPSRDELNALHELYRASFRLLDRRIQSILNLLQEANRWQNTLLVLTSDHGQAFGQHGALFHTLRPDDPLLRVPLWIRFPDGRFAGGSGLGWASLIDIVPTVLSELQIPPPPRLSGIPIQRLVDHHRDVPVFALADGLVHDRARDLAMDKRGEIDRPYVAGYLGSNKAVLDVDRGQMRVYDLENDPGETQPLAVRSIELQQTLVDPVLAIGSRVARQKAYLGQGVEDRLQSWGYL